jgi:hypothetical protein
MSIVECRSEEFYLFFRKRLSNTRRTRRASAGAAGAPALRERNHPSKFCGSIFDILRFAFYLILFL